MSDNNKKKFNLFDLLNRNRIEVDAESEMHLKRDTGFFFKLLGRKLTNIMQINLLLIFGNFPIFFILLALSGNVSASTTAPQSLLFAPLYGAMQFEASPPIMSLFGALGNQTPLIVNTTVTYVMYALGLLVIFTFGIVNAGTALLLRNIVRGEPLFMMHDFFSTIKKNFRQALTLGIIDFLVIFLSIYDIIFFYNNASTTITSTFFVFSIFLALIYLFMRMYMYVLLVTFNLKITKIIKNSFIFAILGFKRNFMALFGIIIVVFLNILLLSNFLPLGMIMPFIITLALIWFMMIYASYPKIKEIMIDPYYNEDGSPKETESAQE